MVENLLRDLRYSLRGLAARPGFTLVAILSLALGIGANTAVFTAINAIFLRPLPVEDPGELVSIFTTVEGMEAHLPVSYPNYRDFREQLAPASSFSDLAAVAPVELSLAGGVAGTGGAGGQEPELVIGELVSGNYFDMLGLRAVVGRTFLPEEDGAPGAHPVVVLSHELWQRRFEGDRGILGRVISLNGHGFTVVGVAPPRFSGTSSLVDARFWVPLAMHQQVLSHRIRGFFEKRRTTSLGVLGRLEDGVAYERARSEITGAAARLAAEYPDDNAGRGVALVPLVQTAVHPDEQGLYSRAGALLAGMVGLVLLIACVNVANMLLVRAAGRRREIAVRLALGARRGRLIRQLLTESLILSLLAGAAGLLLAVWIQRLIAAFQIPFLPDSLDLDMDGRVLAFTLGLSILTGFLFGLIPALQSSRPSLVPALKQGGDPGAGAPGRRIGLRQLLIVAQVSLSLVALIAASLFLISLANAQKIDPGFQAGRLLAVSFNLDNVGYDLARGQQFLRQAVERAEALPGVRSAALAENLALYGTGLFRTATIEGREAGEGRVIAQTNSVDLGYFETMGIPIVQGRAFAGSDRDGSTRVAIVNATLAEAGWPGESPVGKRFRLKPTDDVFEVVGVARDIKYNTLGEEPMPYLYLPLQQAWSPSVTLHVRTERDPAALAGPVRAVLREMAPGLPPPDVRTMEEVLDALLWAPRAAATLLSLFGLSALLLAMIGIYGVTSYLVSQRRREVGIRLALGAQRSDVLRLFLARGMSVVAAGLALGLLGAFALMRLISGLLFGVEGRDPLAFGGAALVLALVALLANYVPARRAAAVPPVEVIRQQ